jgi:hypothetical protein
MGSLEIAVTVQHIWRKAAFMSPYIWWCIPTIPGVSMQRIMLYTGTPCDTSWLLAIEEKIDTF